MAKSPLIQQFRQSGKRLAHLLFDLLTKDASKKVTAFFFLGVFVLFWLYVFQHREVIFVHDAMNYWQARYSFTPNGRFSLLKFDNVKFRLSFAAAFVGEIYESVFG